MIEVTLFDGRKMMVNLRNVLVIIGETGSDGCTIETADKDFRVKEDYPEICRRVALLYEIGAFTH